MTSLPAFWLSCVVALTSWWLTRLFRRYAETRQLLDVPNSRSSHAVATPRGGGVAIVATSLGALALLGLAGLLPWGPLIGLLGGGTAAGLIGFRDDLGHVHPRWRLLGHVMAAIWILFWLGWAPPLFHWDSVPGSPWLGVVLAILYLVWLLNLTNFMDGIDGIASVETLTVSLGGVLLYKVVAPDDPHWLEPLVLAAATSGFLIWNWPPAKIFMGDVGSGFLGLMLAAFSLQAAWVSPPLFFGWVALLGVFVVDATITLFRRIVRRDRIYEAHRSHAYQHAARRWGGHRPVTLATAGVNLLWLLPVALLIALGRLDGPLGVCIAYSPLIAISVWMGAGKPAT